MIGIGFGGVEEVLGDGGCGVLGIGCDGRGPGSSRVTFDVDGLRRWVDDDGLSHVAAVSSTTSGITSVRNTRVLGHSPFASEILLGC